MASDQPGPSLLEMLVHLSTLLQQDASSDIFWPTFSEALDYAFPHISCTILSYDAKSGSLRRLYSSRPEVHPAGGRKRVTDSFWKQTVLDRGEILIGSTREDIKSLFSEYQTLWRHGLESIFNIPVRRGGITIGSINIMNGERAYDRADKGVALLFAQLAVTYLERAAAELQGQGNSHDEDVPYV
ncbi:hypothetical protein N7474_010815 [Penicillium riverlandense]|uniref:uncharacterized protein n=1 Tax=Penicillium riverlandense TaxID=1903569 RepID=UPI002548171C|nr:uncharacterized protein N7474_010815 [Penicillium riverlandense]KAJ5804928.1 hypothetical protein N7474_010815 [Penicillium riverlandense]